MPQQLKSGSGIGQSEAAMAVVGRARLGTGGSATESDESLKRQWEVVAAASRASQKEEEVEKRVRGGAGGPTSEPLLGPRPAPPWLPSPDCPHPRPSSCPCSHVCRPLSEPPAALGAQQCLCFLTRPLLHLRAFPGTPLMLQALPGTLSAPSDSHSPPWTPGPSPALSLPTQVLGAPGLSASPSFLLDSP